MEYNEDEYLMLSGIQHYSFCRRQWALIHIEQQWKDNYRTTAGELMHKRAHKDNLYELRGNILTAHNLKVSSRILGITGQCDIVEFHRDENGIRLNRYDGKWRIIPVEYKRGELKEGIEDELQLCLQAMCLEEQFISDIPKGFLYYGEKRRRSEVVFSEELREAVKANVQEMHQLMNRGYTPKVKVTNKCKACSLHDICLPILNKDKDVSRYIKQYLDGDDL